HTRSDRDWSSDVCSSDLPHFHFQFVDVVAGAHNPEGKLQGAEFTFPYPTDTFDIALASSVFTHMLPGGVEHYVAETARVLKPGRSEERRVGKEWRVRGVT